MNKHAIIPIPEIKEFIKFLSLTVDVKLINDISSINKITVVEQFFLSDSDNRVQAFYLIEKLGPQLSNLHVILQRFIPWYRSIFGVFAQKGCTQPKILFGIIF